jgi:hypothetical protein
METWPHSNTDSGSTDAHNQARLTTCSEGKLIIKRLQDGVGDWSRAEDAMGNNHPISSTRLPCAGQPHCARLITYQTVAHHDGERKPGEPVGGILGVARAGQGHPAFTVGHWANDSPANNGPQQHGGTCTASAYGFAAGCVCVCVSDSRQWHLATRIHLHRMRTWFRSRVCVSGFLRICVCVCVCAWGGGASKGAEDRVHYGRLYMTPKL